MLLSTNFLERKFFKLLYIVPLGSHRTLARLASIFFILNTSNYSVLLSIINYSSVCYCLFIYLSIVYHYCYCLLLLLFIIIIFNKINNIYCCHHYYCLIILFFILLFLFDWMCYIIPLSSSFKSASIGF